MDWASDAATTDYRVSKIFKEAERFLRQAPPPAARELDLVEATRMYEEARALLARGEDHRAIDLLHSAARAPRVAARALYLKARIERRLNKLQTAITTLKAALHHADGYEAHCVPIFVEIGDTYAQLGIRDEAAYYYRRAIRLAPARPDLASRLERCVGQSNVRRVRGHGQGHEVETKDHARLRR